jgi:membrane associated rhomboid family serine protease
VTDARSWSGRTPAIWLVVIVNVIVFLAMANEQGAFSMSPELVVEWGAIVPARWMQGEYWRLLAAGFLHFGPMHLIANMICLVAWGVPLERGLGFVRFLVLFIVSILSGAVATMTLHSGIFVGAGASGGTSGLLGALLMLAFFRYVRLPLSFFLINIGLNIAVAVMMPSIDWKAHLFGFLGGFLVVPLLLIGRRG